MVLFFGLVFSVDLPLKIVFLPTPLNVQLNIFFMRSSLSASVEPLNILDAPTYFYRVKAQAIRAGFTRCGSLGTFRISHKNLVILA